MASKTFKIGEYAIGGIIQVRITENVIKIDALDWTTKEKIMGREFNAEVLNADYEVIDYLNELTSSYYADQVLEFIKKNVNFIYQF
jgi:hypothetical protein